MTQTLTCPFDDLEGHKPHVFPDDWELGGRTGSDPRVDPRWRGSTYYYFDADLTLLHVTQVPFCDDAALDYCTTVSGWGNPRYIQVKRPGDDKPSALPWNYFKETDELMPA